MRRGNYDAPHGGSRGYDSRAVIHAGQHNSDHEEQVFRKVRGILNKLTIEKFDRLVPQLYDVGIESETTLKGIILLVFEKALDEPNFSSMYAQVCERLSEHGPDFEPPDVHQPGSKAPSTFIRLLLQKCQEEFENRSRAEELAAACGSIKDVVPGSEEFRKIMAANAALLKARTKMLGNIKFIGELGKLKLVTEKILHDLIKVLCDRTVDPALEDVECLCELLKTVGALLDHTKAKRLFDQYFGQIAQMREDASLPARIKFLIDDVTELRENGWEMRDIMQNQGPKTLQQIHLEAYEEQLQNGKYSNQSERQAGLDKIIKLRRGMNIGAGGVMQDEFMDMPIAPTILTREMGTPSQPGMFSGMTRQDDFLGNLGGSRDPGPFQMQSLSQSLGGLQSQGNAFGQRSRGSHGPPQDRGQQQFDSRGQQGGYGNDPRNDPPPSGRDAQGRLRRAGDPRDSHGQQQGGGYGGDRGRNGYGNQQGGNQYPNQQGGNQYPNQQGGYSNQQGGGGYMGNPNDRPSYSGDGGRSSQGYNDPRDNYAPGDSRRLSASIPNSNLDPQGITLGTRGTRGIDKKISLKPQTRLGQGAAGGRLAAGSALSGNVPSSISRPSNPKMNALTKKKKEKKEKKLTKAELDSKTNSLLEEYLGIRDNEEALRCFKELKAPQYAKTLFSKATMMAVEKSDADRGAVSDLFVALSKDGQLDKDAIAEGLDMVTEQVADLCIDIPMIYSYVGSIIARMISDELMTMQEVAHALRGGTFLKLYVKTLEALKKTKGEDGLSSLFKDSGVDMYTMMPEARRNEDELTDVLSDNGLMCLSPTLQLKSQLTAQLAQHVDFSKSYDGEEVHPGAITVSQWLNALPANIKDDEAYIMTVARAFIGYVTSSTTLSPSVGTSAAEVKAAKVTEESYFKAVSPVLEAVVRDNDKKQVEVVYALQWFCHQKKHPKGVMLRFSKYFYDFDVVEEEAFTVWREEVKAGVPGKGDALVAINEYLNWMRSAVEESDDEDEEDIDALMPKR